MSNKNNVHVSDVPVQHPNTMRINTEMLECKMDGIKRTVTATITGNSKRDDADNIIMRPKLDANGKPIDKNGKPVLERVPEFEPTTVTYTIDMTNVPLTHVIDRYIASLTIKIANDVRPDGLLAVKELDGKILSGVELMTDSKMKLSKVAKSERLIETASVDEINQMIEIAKRKLQSLQNK